jgi:hypothetical protein
MRSPKRCVRVLTRATAVSASLVMAGCGSTMPAGPSPVPGPAPQYPSLLGDWVNVGTRLVLQDRDSGRTVTYGCETSLRVSEQTGGTFSGFARAEGGSGESGMHCSHQSSFSAQMTADGIITSFRFDRPFASDCAPLSEASGSGTASSTALGIKMTDHGTCLVGPLREPRDTDRTLTISVIPQPR